jgi:hypothetical protein
VVFTVASSSGTINLGDTVGDMGAEVGSVSVASMGTRGRSGAVEAGAITAGGTWAGTSSMGMMFGGSVAGSVTGVVAGTLKSAGVVFSTLKSGVGDSSAEVALCNNSTIIRRA